MNFKRIGIVLSGFIAALTILSMLWAGANVFVSAAGSNVFEKKFDHMKDIADERALREKSLVDQKEYLQLYVTDAATKAADQAVEKWIRIAGGNYDLLREMDRARNRGGGRPREPGP